MDNYQEEIKLVKVLKNLQDDFETTSASSKFLAKGTCKGL